MPRGKNHGLLIAGDGPAAALAALAVAAATPDAPPLLVGESGAFAGDSLPGLLLDAALGDEERAFLDTVTAMRWEAFYAVLPNRTRKLKLPCRLVSAQRIESALRRSLPAARLRSGRRIVAVRDTSLLLEGGETLEGDGAIDARPFAQQTTLDLGWRHVLARTCELPAPHRLDLPVLVDTSVPGTGTGCAHFACTPLAPTTLLLEHVRYADSPEPEVEGARLSLDGYAARRGWADGTTVAETATSLPLPLGGDFAAYYRIGGARVAKLGARGGFSFPTTGSALPDALRTARLLAARRDFAGPALHDLFEETALGLWRRRETYREFDRKLIRGNGCAALEALFGADGALIGRFFAERMGLFDRRKLAALAG